MRYRYTDPATRMTRIVVAPTRSKFACHIRTTYRGVLNFGGLDIESVEIDEKENELPFTVRVLVDNPPFDHRPPSPKRRQAI